MNELSVFGHNLNNIKVNIENSLKDLQDFQLKMYRQFATIHKAMVDASVNAPTSVTNSINTSSKVTTVNGVVTAYKTITKDGVTSFMKGTKTPSGSFMWGPCPESEIDVAKEFVKEPVVDTTLMRLDKVLKMNPGFRQRINDLLAGEQWLTEALPETGEPTEKELNELDFNEKESCENVLNCEDARRDEVNNGEVSTDEVSTNEVSTNEVSTNEVSTNEVSTDEINANEVHENEVEGNRVSENGSQETITAGRFVRTEDGRFRYVRE